MKFKHSFRVGIYTVHLTYTTASKQLMAKWKPHPPRRRLFDQEWDQFRMGRDVLLREIHQATGEKLVAVEAPR